MADKLNIPRTGALAILRNRRGLITAVEPSGSRAEEKIHLVNVEYTDPDGCQEDQVIWEREPDAQIIEPTALPDIHHKNGPMLLDEYNAMVRATRWAALTPYIAPDGDGPLERLPISSPFHGAIQIDDFQFVPLIKALKMPRFSLLIADDVGLGKTIEAGLILSELLLRRRIRRVLILSPASLCTQWQSEMWDKFSIPFDIINRKVTHQMKRDLGMDANPWRTFQKAIVSYHYLKQSDILEDFLSTCRQKEETAHLPWDFLIVDEVHNLSPAAFGKDSDLSNMLKAIVPFFEHKIFLTATPHNGHTRCFTGLLELLDPVRFSKTNELTEGEKKRIREVVVRRLKREINKKTDKPRFCERELKGLEIELFAEEKKLARAYQGFRKKIRSVIAKSRKKKEQLAGNFAVEVLGKRLLSCPVAFATSWHRYQEGLKDEEEATVNEVVAIEKSLKEDSADDREKESRTALAAHTVGAWLKPLKDQIENESLEIENALKALKLDKAEEMTTEKIKVKKDSRLEVLMSWIEKYLRKSGEWLEEERLVVFTEYKTTLDYIHQRLVKKYSDDRILMLFGGMTDEEREGIKKAFNDPENPVRILIATDAASEGLNLQQTARYLLHFDIPWNPTRLEQRNGRLDRHGQARDVSIFHFTSNEDADLSFLAYVVKKVNSIREDLGSMEQVFDTAIQKCLVEGEERQWVEKELDSRTRQLVGKTDIHGDNACLSTESEKIGEEEALEALKKEIDLKPESLAETLDVAIGMRAKRPCLKKLDKYFYRLQNNPANWQTLIDDYLRLKTISGARGALPRITFNPAALLKDIGGRTIFRVPKDASLLHLGHPVFHHALSSFSRIRFPGQDSSASRWTVTRGRLPENCQALLLLTVEELAMNNLREVFHHWVRTHAIPINDGILARPLPHVPASQWVEGTLPSAPQSTQKAMRILDEVETDIKKYIRTCAEDLTRLLKTTLNEEKKKAASVENERFQSRQGELSKLIQNLTIQRLEKDIERELIQSRQTLLFEADLELRETMFRDKEEELKRRKGGYEELRQHLEKERKRILNFIIPNRFELRGEAQVFPVAMEIRLPEVEK
ncbi:DISARM system SNF2-like helicase DrmD [Candidatus Riflebacteria bacterium]